MAVVFGYPGLWMSKPEAKINFLKIVRGEQRLRLHHLFPTKGTLKAKNRVSHVIDKAANKGSLVIVERRIYNEQGTLLATTAQTTFCRADGGFAQSDEPPAVLPKVPETESDACCELPILPQAAALYRLNVDPNPLHIDPEVAKAAGYEQPILHGLCTHGMVARALFDGYCDVEPELLLRFDARFRHQSFPVKRWWLRRGV